MRLSDTKLFSLRYASLRGDLIEVFKIFNRLCDVELEPLLTLSQTGLRNDGLKIIQKRSNTNIRTLGIPPTSSGGSTQPNKLQN